MFFVNMKNDVGFIIYDQLNLWEAQSGWNENIPLRNLLYCTDEIRRKMNENEQKPARNPKITIPFIRCVVDFAKIGQAFR